MSNNAVRDQVFGDEIERLHAESYGVYEVWKMHYLMRRQSWVVRKNYVARLMKTG